MTDEEKEIIERAEHVLSSIVQELRLAEQASDPYPLEKEYVEWMLDSTQGLVYNDGEWWYKHPSLAQAKEICASHQEHGQ